MSRLCAGALPDTGRTQEKTAHPPLRSLPICKSAQHFWCRCSSMGTHSAPAAPHRVSAAAASSRAAARPRTRRPRAAQDTAHGDGLRPIAEKYLQQPSPVFTAPSSTIHPRSSGRMLTANPRSRMPMNTAAVRKPKSICSAAFSCPVMCTARLFSVIITA